MIRQLAISLVLYSRANCVNRAIFKRNQKMKRLYYYSTGNPLCNKNRLPIDKFIFDTTIMKRYIIAELSKGEKIEIRNQQFGDSDLKMLCQIKAESDKKPNNHMSQIKELSLYAGNVSSKGMIYFQQASWINLTCLILSQCKIGDLGLKFLSRTAFDNLQKLIFYNNSIGKNGLHHLAKTQWKKLQNFESYANMQRGGIEWLGKCNWKNAKRIFILYSRLTEIDVSDLLILQSNQIQQMWIHENSVQNNYKEKLEKYLYRRYLKLGEGELTL